MFHVLSAYTAVCTHMVYGLAATFAMVGNNFTYVKLNIKDRVTALSPEHEVLSKQGALTHK